MLAVFTAAAAFAIPAPPKGAQQMTQVLQAYFGAPDGVVSVSPEGEAYSLTIDAAPLLALAPAELTGTTISFIIMQVTDNGDGTWAVTQDQAFAFARTLPGIADISLDIARMWGVGVFDQELKACVSSHSEFTGMAITEPLTQPGQPPVGVTISLASGLIDATAQANPAGGVDSTSTMTMTGLAETISMPPMGAGRGGNHPCPGSVTGNGYELTCQRVMTAGPAALPAGSGTVTLTGAISAALAAAPAEVKDQALPGFAMAQGMAKPDENGALVWEIDATRPGTLMINGLDMMGGQQESANASGQQLRRGVARHTMPGLRHKGSCAKP